MKGEKIITSWCELSDYGEDNYRYIEEKGYTLKQMEYMYKGITKKVLNG